MTIREEKKALRAILKERASGLSEDYCKGADLKIHQKIYGMREYEEAKVIFSFVGMETEIGTSPILTDALKRGKRVGVPKCVSKGVMLVYEIHGLSDLKPGAFGILEPEDKAVLIRPEEIDLALIPCLSAWKDGRRLGYGGGYYDRYLENVTGYRAVLCREKMMCRDIPTEPHDKFMDAVICEGGIFCK